MAGARDTETWLDLRNSRTLAITAATLFLANLMLAPGFAFLALLWLWRTTRNGAAPVARQHLDQAVRASIVGGCLLMITALIAVFGGLHSAWTWVAVILYFTCVHSTLILLGVIALVQAINDKPWRYPLIGGPRQ
ncbi:MAG: hypothetical protein U1F34_01430 [Gammaproteobacteria bacterium]